MSKNGTSKFTGTIKKRETKLLMSMLLVLRNVLKGGIDGKMNFERK